MKLSIAMCTYNGESFLQEQLESIALQTRLPDELIVCDDCSTDKTTEIIESFAATHPFPVKLSINEKNLGSTKNFEKAIGLCEGDVIALCDQDDVWLPHKLESIEEKFSSAPNVGLVFSDGEIVDDHLKPMGKRLWDYYFSPREQRLFKEGKAFNVLLRHSVVTGATLAFRGKFKERLLPIPEEGHLIHDAWISLMIAGTDELAPLDSVLIKYRQHDGQQRGVRLWSGKGRPNLSRAQFFYEQAESYLKDVPLLLRVKKQIQENLNGNSAERLKAVTARIAFLHEASKHSRMRGTTNALSERATRVPKVIKELLKLRYHRYSRGLRSAAKDLINN